MTVFYGDEAVTHLSQEAKRIDKKSSSHWDKFHKNFSFSGQEFTGINGFGSNEEEYTGFKKLMHILFQAPYRRMGRKYHLFDEIDNVCRNILSKQRKGYSLDVLRQAITLAYLHDKSVVKNNGLSCVIGDGYAIMTSLLMQFSRQRVILVNLNKTLLVDLWQLKLLLGDDFNTEVALITNRESVLELLSRKETIPHVIALKAEDHELIQLFKIDLYINIASMQEMNPNFIKEYFYDMRIASRKQSSFFYCCNRESKTLPDGTRVDFDEYPWDLDDVILADELCPWHLKYYNIKPPFYHNYDGPIRHRLAEFS